MEMIKAFTQVAIPHEDIREGELTMEVFAADLWEVVKGTAPLDYKDPDLFSAKTYYTEELKHILEIARQRLEGKSTNSTLQLQTPFGGGKTHTLIALYHKAREWNVKVVVLDGTAFDVKEKKLWEELERQLTGTVNLTAGQVSPGKEKLVQLLSAHGPVLILMDEILTYLTKAGGIEVGKSDLASQTLAFIQELTGAVASVGNALLVLTLPSSSLEHYGEYSEKMFHKLQKITGRVEKIYTPVKEEEIENVINKRLFSEIKKDKVKLVVDAFVKHAKQEGLLSDDEELEYRERFLRSYPFKPEVIDVIYKRWGSIPTFQRTRGVLRLLGLVLNDLLTKPIPFIRLGDFNLARSEIRQELLKHIGTEWNSIISHDITSASSGAKWVDKNLGPAYQSFQLGTVISTTIFMMSFSGKTSDGKERGASQKEIKLSSLEPSFSSSIIDTAISKLKEKLFYLSDEGLFFDNQPNLNKIIILKKENVSDNQILEEERRIIEHYLSKERNQFRVYIHPRFSKEVPDNEELKLVILCSSEPDKEFLEKYGEKPRVFRNVMVFLCVDEANREHFYSFIKDWIALNEIKGDSSIKLTEAQKRELENKIKSYKNRMYEELCRFYRKIYLPVKEGWKEIVTGIPMHGEKERLDERIYDRLRADGELLKELSPTVIQKKYLSGKSYIEIKALYDSFLKTPGELRIISREKFLESIREGVKNGLFGLGHLEEGQPVCEVIGEDVSDLRLEEGKLIIAEEECKKPEEAETEVEGDRISANQVKEAPSFISQDRVEIGSQTTVPHEEKIKGFKLKLNILNAGGLSPIAKALNRSIYDSFSQVEVEVSINAGDGEMGELEFDEKVLEVLRDENIEIKDKKIFYNK